MNFKILFPVIALLLPSFVGAATTIASFDGAVPTTPGWQIVGGLPLDVFQDEGRNVIEFKDESDTDFASLVYRLTEEQAIEMVSGFTFVARICHISNGSTGGNFRLLMRIPGFGSAQFSAYHNARDGGVNLAIYDSVQQMSISVPLSTVSRQYVTIKGVFRPGVTFEGPGTMEVFINDKPTITVGLARGASPHAQIEIGGVGGAGVVRTSHNLISDFKMTTP